MDFMDRHSWLYCLDTFVYKELAWAVSYIKNQGTFYTHICIDSDGSLKWQSLKSVLT